MAVTLTIGGRRVLYPGTAYRNAIRNHTPTEFWGKANSYTCPRGPEPGRAFLLLNRDELNNVPNNGYHDLKWTNGDRVLTVKNLVLIDTRCMDLSLAGDITAMHFCTFADVRHVLKASPINDQYNIRHPAPNDTSGATLYYGDSINGALVWTWQTLLDDIWGNLPTKAGTAPTLPYTPDGTPEGFRFIGVSAWDALHTVLTKVGCTTALNPTTGVFSYVRLGTAQTDAQDKTIADLTTQLKDRLMFEYDPTTGLNLSEMPATVRVYFHRQELYHGIEKDTPRASNWEMEPVVTKDHTTGISGAAAGSVLQIWDDLPALYDSTGTNTNSADLVTRAAEIGGNLVNRIQTSQALLHRVYSGITTKFLPGSEIAEVRWREYGDSKGLVTEVMNKPVRDVLDEFVNEHLAPPDFARHTHPLYPRVSQIVQVDDGASATGADVSPNGDGLIPGNVLRWANGAYSALEACWIRPADLEAGGSPSEATVVDLRQKDRMVGRLSGSETSSSITRPVYLVRKGGMGFSFIIQGDEGDTPTVTEGDTIDFDASGLSFATEANSTVSLRGIVVRVDDNDPTHDVSFAVDKSVAQHVALSGSFTVGTCDVRDGTRNTITFDASAGDLPPIQMSCAAGIITVSPRNPFHTITNHDASDSEDLDFQDTLEFKHDNGIDPNSVSRAGSTTTVRILGYPPVGTVLLSYKKPILEAGKYYMDGGDGVTADTDWALMDGSSNSAGSSIDMGCGGTSSSDPSFYLRARNDRTADANTTAHGRTNDATPADDVAAFSVADHPDHRHSFTNDACHIDPGAGTDTHYDFTTQGTIYTGGAINTSGSSPITLDHTITITNNETSNSDELEMLPPTKMLFFYERVATGSNTT